MTQHCQMCDGTKADCTPCPGMVCEECADAQTRIEGLLAMVTERDQQIAALTAMLEKSVTLDVWRMTVREFEKQIATLRAKLEVAERERDSFQRVGKHYEYLLAKAAELLKSGGTGRTCALVVSQDLPKLLAERDTLQAKLVVAEHDAKLHSALLARQTDLVREAEIQLAVRIRGECTCPGGECTHLPCDPWVARALHAEQQIADLQAKLEAAERERLVGDKIILTLNEDFVACQAERNTLRALVAVGREMANLGGGMAAMFAEQWIDKDTDDEAKEAVRLWWESQEEWRRLDTEP